ncbi:MAG: ATPase, T2SS/T4P/T4SS family [bacterium]
MMPGTGNPLGQMLVSQGKLDPDDLDVALKEHFKSGERIGTILIKMGLATEETILRTLGQQLGIPYVNLSEIQIQKQVLERMPAKLVNHYHLIPISQADGSLKVAVSDPLDIHTLDDLRLALKTEVEPVISTKKDIDEAIKKYYGIGAETVEELMDESSGTVDIDQPEVENIEDMAEDASIVRFVNQIIMEAVSARGTDIHFEPFEGELRVRYRIDGLLSEAAIPPSIKRFQSAILSRLKIMADMNIAERRLPQDGKIKIKFAEEEYDLRVSTVPTPYGESIAIRILTRSPELINLERLGFDSYHLAILRQMIQKPHGIILVTGPTGSGKSTTLYASLSEINTIDKKIITIEDPIEYKIPGVTQIQVNPQIDLTFARCLRTILRQDPDILMVGETRDQETAQITIRTALTGHLVFSTLHTNDACGAITRLLDMGIEPFLAASSIEGIIAQRLVRLLCPQCKAPYHPPDALLRRINVTKEDINSFTFYKPVGCDQCRYTGYRGRTAIYEMVRINEELRRRVVELASSTELKAVAMKHGMQPIRFDGWKKVKRNLTTIEEVLRVTMEDEFLEDEPEGQAIPVPPPAEATVQS